MGRSGVGARERERRVRGGGERKGEELGMGRSGVGARERERRVRGGGERKGEEG